MPGFDFDPGSERLKFGDDDWALHPLTDSAALHYRFASGDTLTINLPANERDVVLYEVLVEPRRADFNLVAGSLWFDAASASLVRATYKPGRPFNLAIEEPGDGDDVPGFFQPVEADIDYITVEYSLQELQYWLPRRFAFQGEARLGSLIRIPITLEWNVGGYIVNEAQSTLFLEGELPDGWQRQENVEETDDGVEIRTTVIVPTTDELRESTRLSESFGERSPLVFSTGEIERLVDELEGLLPTYRRFRPSFEFGFEKGMRRHDDDDPVVDEHRPRSDGPHRERRQVAQCVGYVPVWLGVGPLDLRGISSPSIDGGRARSLRIHELGWQPVPGE
jgi:hypothetical protein